ncbi:helix-turn-helix transcriptional regulator|uniref:Helix-turn-helix domain-containing protein n=1 Tax=Dendrosporobacter quercicolus TaxID=146817 RepID=A0A1H0AR50_9FIRM|nr:helix-turn-helix transcriptional regulator [Dendrosporobacter quercicolus]NSL50100.1 helix-turn-helix transcriptional regulator [Dendrosporobacter quercicolus DSM 1736]SDN35506.1 Helix-turn-helix domain-containing protein [Dendrosporobacter quercicolus]
MTFGEILRNAREQNHLSQEDTARAIEKRYGVRMSPSYLSMIENGARANLTVKSLSALLDFFDLPLDSALSLFKLSTKTAALLENREKYTAIPAVTDSDQALAGLPEEAIFLIREFTEYIIYKYKIPDRER